MRMQSRRRRPRRSRKTANSPKPQRCAHAMPSDRSVRSKSKGGAPYPEDNRTALDEVIDQRTDSAEAEVRIGHLGEDAGGFASASIHHEDRVSALHVLPQVSEGGGLWLRLCRRATARYPNQHPHSRLRRPALRRSRFRHQPRCRQRRQAGGAARPIGPRCVRLNRSRTRGPGLNISQHHVPRVPFAFLPSALPLSREPRPSLFLSSARGSQAAVPSQAARLGRPNCRAH